jgi:hypothetical protein
MSGVRRAGRPIRVCRCGWCATGWTAVDDWAVFWLMFMVVVALWWVALQLRGRRLRAEHERWQALYGHGGRFGSGGPPRVVP